MHCEIREEPIQQKSNFTKYTFQVSLFELNSLNSLFDYMSIYMTYPQQRLPLLYTLCQEM